jgi:hypothetical protein
MPAARTSFHQGTAPPNKWATSSARQTSQCRTHMLAAHRRSLLGGVGRDLRGDLHRGRQFWLSEAAREAAFSFFLVNQIFRKPQDWGLQD